jgi:hypothetical protein
MTATEIRRSSIFAADDVEAIVNPVNCVGTLTRTQFARPVIATPHLMRG